MLSGTSVTYIVVAIVSILISLVIHEFMHAFTAYKLGDTTAARGGRLTLNPLDHIDPFMTIALPIITLLIFHAPILAAKPVPFNPDRVKYDEFGAAMIAAAGPLTNLVLAFGAALIAGRLNGGFWLEAMQIFGGLNIALFVFNLIPIPPLDGSRVLYAFAPEPLQDIMRQIEPYGFFIVFGLVLLGGLGGFILGLNEFMLHLPVLRALV